MGPHNPARDDERGGNPFLELCHVGNDADKAAPFLEVHERVHGFV